MSNADLLEQAEVIVDLIPRTMRRLFILDVDDPATDLPVAQLRVCGILKAGARTVSDLSGELGVSISAATQLADRLERSGLVERVQEPDDRRVRHLRLTTQGKRMMVKRHEKRLARAAEVLGALDSQQRLEVVRALRTLYSATKTASPVVAGDSILTEIAL